MCPGQGKTILPWGVMLGVAVSLSARLAGGQTSLKLEVSSEQVRKYEKVEFPIHLDTAYRNPFDPEEVDLRLELQCPGGRRLSLPAFYVQPYERRTLEQRGRPVDWFYPAGSPVWKARFAPMEVGKYSCTARLRDRNGTAASNAVTFECIPSQRYGYVRVSTKDPRFFEFTDGTPFFPIGQNLAFIGSMQYVNLAKTQEVFRRMAENGANYVRIWACCEDWAMAVEARKSAWGRSWSWKPPIVLMPGSAGYHTDAQCLQVAGAEGTALAVAPSHPVALRPNTLYVVSGRVRAEEKAGLQLEVNGERLGEVIVPEPQRQWTEFQREFQTAPDTWWLNAMRFHLNGSGTVWLRDLSLREKAGGPELLWEADVNRPLPGVYNPVDSFLLDQVVEAAEANGIYLQICLLTRNLYMDALGDEKSPDYERAIHYAKKLLRYAVARWGYSTSVVAWEYWNEMNPNLPTDRFYAELGRYLEETDPYRHLRATSAWGPSPKDWRHPQLDAADMHWYLRPNWSELWKDAVAAVADRAQFLLEHTPRKPALLSEFGLADERWGLSPYMKQDKDLVHFHNALWASALSGLAGTAMFWWWETLDQQDAYRHYRPLAAFLADVPFTTSQLRKASATVSDSRVRVVGLQGQDGAYLWLSDAEATWWRLVVEKAAPSEIRGAFLDIEGLAPGTYWVQWWDTYAGKVVRQEEVSGRGQRLRTTVPPFARDIACKVRRQPKGR